MRGRLTSLALRGGPFRTLQAVNEQVGAVRAFCSRDLGQRRSTAQHAIEPLHDDERVGASLPQAPEALVEVSHIIMTEPNGNTQQFRIRLTTEREP